MRLHEDVVVVIRRPRRQIEMSKTPRRQKKIADALEEREVVAGDEIGFGNQVEWSGWARDRSADGTSSPSRSSSSRTRSSPARNSRCLGADDLDGVLVRAHRSIRAQPVEQCTNGARIFGREGGIVVQAGVGDIVLDADGEVVLRLRLLQLIEDALHHGRREFFGRQAIPSADHARALRKWRGAEQRFAERGHHIQVERFAERCPAPWCGRARRWT